jgi:hypothetical protein
MNASLAYFQKPTGKTPRIQFSGSHFYCIQGTGLIQFDNGSALTLQVGLKLDWPAGEGFSSIQVINETSGNGAKFYAGDVEIGVNLPS